MAVRHVLRLCCAAGVELKYRPGSACLPQLCVRIHAVAMLGSAQVSRLSLHSVRMRGDFVGAVDDCWTRDLNSRTTSYNRECHSAQR